MAAAYINTAEKYGVEIKMSEQVEKSFYDRRSGTILLYPHIDILDQILLITRELRSHWQHRQGVLINPLTFTPEHAILINRAQEADLAVSVIRTAWELQLAGKKDVWERVENSPLSDKIFTAKKTNNLIKWWVKLLQQAAGGNQEPLLFFKYNRSPVFVVTNLQPKVTAEWMYIQFLHCYILLADVWLKEEEVEFLNGV